MDTFPGFYIAVYKFIKLPRTSEYFTYHLFLLHFFFFCVAGAFDQSGSVSGAVHVQASKPAGEAGSKGGSVPQRFFNLKKNMRTTAVLPSDDVLHSFYSSHVAVDRYQAALCTAWIATLKMLFRLRMV